MMLDKILPGKTGFIRLSGRAVASFFVTFALCILLICFSVINKTNVEHLKMERLIIEKSAKATENITQLLYKTQILAAFVINNGGKFDDFDSVASVIIDDPAISSVVAAPDGIVTRVYPMEGNERVLGLNYFSPGAGNLEAIKAKETGDLVFGGPFDAVQGGQILVGRMPVYLNNTAGDKEFWGIVAISLKYPQAIEAAGFDELNLQGFAYEIWRINPDTGEKQIITSCDSKYSENARYIEKHMSILNADWYFRILPVKAWFEYLDTWLLICVGLFISFLFAFVVQSHSDMQIMKNTFELLSHTDPLTGIYNRRYFMELALTHIERTSRQNTGAYFMIIDIDKFKTINDTYGHHAGDDALVGIAGRLKENLRPYDLLSRHGGEEFVILSSDINKENVIELAERLRTEIETKPFRCAGNDLHITASFGICEVTCTDDYYKAIENADKALYEAKNTGRNKVVFYENNKKRRISAY